MKTGNQEETTHRRCFSRLQRSGGPDQGFHIGGEVSRACPGLGPPATVSIYHKT
jgi:hypothetical protein